MNGGEQQGSKAGWSMLSKKHLELFPNGKVKKFTLVKMIIILDQSFYSLVSSFGSFGPKQVSFFKEKFQAVKALWNQDVNLYAFCLSTLSLSNTMDLEAWKEVMGAQRQEFLEDNKHEDLFVGEFVDQLRATNEFEIQRGRHGGSKPCK